MDNMSTDRTVAAREGGERVSLPDKIVPNSQQSPRRYLSPDDRDFFAVYRRLGRTSPGSGSK
jgi:hypothetical protein